MKINCLLTVVMAGFLIMNENDTVRRRENQTAVDGHRLNLALVG